MNHTYTSDEERRNREAALDETLAETFPASDPLSTLPNPDDPAPADGDERGRVEGRLSAARQGQPPHDHED